MLLKQKMKSQFSENWSSDRAVDGRIQKKIVSDKSFPEERNIFNFNYLFFWILDFHVQTVELNWECSLH